MKLSLLSVIALASALPTKEMAKKDFVWGKDFILVSCAPGTPVHNQDIKKVDSHPHVFTVGGDEGSTVFLNLNDDTSMSDASGRGIYMDPNTGEFGNVDPWGEQQPSKGFTICPNGLCYNDNCNWRACPSAPGVYSFTQSDCIGGTDIRILVAYPL